VRRSGPSPTEKDRSPSKRSTVLCTSNRAYRPRPFGIATASHPGAGGFAANVALVVVVLAAMVAGGLWCTASASARSSFSMAISRRLPEVVARACARTGPSSSSVPAHISTNTRFTKIKIKLFSWKFNKFKPPFELQFILNQSINQSINPINPINQSINTHFFFFNEGHVITK